MLCVEAIFLCLLQPATYLPHTLFCRCLDAALQEGLPLEVSLSSGEHHCAVEIAPSGDGRWVCSYTPPAPGFYRLEAASRGVPVAGSPFSVQARFGVPL